MSADAAIRAVQDAVRGAAEAGGTVRAAGGATKTALAPAPGDPGRLDVAPLAGVVEYEPAEYTVTVRAGTRIADVQALLAEEGQHLPFDPPLAAAGATAGGTVASGLSGPGRFRYGGVRDFLLGIRFVDGRGDLHAGGGRVVKNAAGFDLPKLMVGALGRFGVLTELTFKVFPTPEAHATLTFDAGTPAQAADLLQALGRSSLEAVCLELEPPGRLRIRVGGASAALDRRLERVQHALSGDGEVARGDDDARIWRDAAAFAWVPEGHALVKVPLTPPRVMQLEDDVRRLEGEHGIPVPRRISVGGNLAWLAWPEAEAAVALRDLLTERGLAGLVVRGEAFGFGRHDPRIGPRGGGAFLERIASVLDPHGVFDHGPAGSDPSRPDRLDPDPTALGPSDPDPTSPDPTGPDPTGPDPTGPDPTGSGRGPGPGSGPDCSADVNRSERAA